MGFISSAQAAKRLNVNVQKFHRLVEQHQLEPAFKAAGEKGARFWKVETIDRLAEIMRQELLDEIAALDAGRNAS
jgi:hypothetical protein